VPSLQLICSISVGAGRCLQLYWLRAILYGCLCFCSSRYSVFKNAFLTSQISYSFYITKTGFFFICY
jgi:hypothetical protein